MGAGAGHMLSPWEATDLKFAEIRDIINKSLIGQLENVSEKLDGQNMMITFKNDHIYLARSQKQMKNGGKLAVRWDKAKANMNPRTPDETRDQYENAMNDLQLIFINSRLSMNDIFKGGTKWLNIEWLNPTAHNIIPYNEFIISIHNIREVDKDAKTIDIDHGDKELDKIINDFKQSQSELSFGHTIIKTNNVSFDKIRDIESINKLIITKLQVLMDRNSLNYNDTLSDYIENEVRTWLEPKILDQSLLEGLIRRWVYSDKSTSITKLLKDRDKDIVKWIKIEDKIIARKIGKILDPIIEIFSRLGIAVLQNVSGIAATNKDKVSLGIKKKSEDAIKKIDQFIIRTDIEDQFDFEKKVDYLETQLRRIEQSGGLDGIAPTEGIVFEYKNNLFKLTGNYLPLLKIINFFQFGKDK